MRTMSFFKYVLFSFVVMSFLSACVDHVAEEEELPNKDVAFEYSIVDESYVIDYYVGAQIKFVNTSYLSGTPTWDFDLGTEDEIVKGTINSDTVVIKYKVSGLRAVKLTVNNKTIEQPIFISDIKPILLLDSIEGALCEVLTTEVSFSVDLPNPENLDVVYSWTFPENTTDEKGDTITKFEGENPGKVRFGNVGSQFVKLNVTLGGRALEEVSLNVQVAYNKEVPTLYYAEKGGNIMALKLASDAPKDMKIEPFDMGVKSGQHPLNIVFADSSLYILDCGLQFTYVNDVDGVMGDGRIIVMSKDGSVVETMLSNVGGAAFDDPFYGYADKQNLYVGGRLTGFYKIGLKERNVTYSLNDYPYYVQNNTLGYYNKGTGYASMNACIGKVGDVWYWCKTNDGKGIIRFTDSDILKETAKDTDPKPAAGIALPGMDVKSFVYDKNSGAFYFALFGVARDGVYRCASIAELDNVSATNLVNYQCKTADDRALTLITEAGKGEGSSGEFIGICQMAIDESTGDVYFGLRSGDASMKSGVYRYNATSRVLESVIEGVNVYGVAINQNPSKLF